MHCDEFETRIQELLDRRRRLTDDVLLRQHAQDCCGCAAILEAYVELFQRIERWESPQLDPDFSRRTVQKAFPAMPAAARRSSVAGRFARVRSFALVACGVLVVATIGIGLPWIADDRASDRSLAESDFVPGSRGNSSPAVMTAPEVPQPIQRLGQADGGWLTLWVEWSSHLEPDRFESLGTFRQGIKPIAVSLTTALDSLRTSLPLYDRQPTAEDAA
jgi:hypothetical protein